MTHPVDPNWAAAGSLPAQLPYFKRVGQSFSIPAYRSLWFSSLFGSMRLIVVFLARGWLVLELTDSPFWVGFAPALRGFTQIFFGAFSGVLLDRFDRRKLLVLAESFATLIAFIIGLLILFERIELWHIMAASAVKMPRLNAAKPGPMTVTLTR